MEKLYSLRAEIRPRASAQKLVYQEEPVKGRAALEETPMLYLCQRNLRV